MTKSFFKHLATTLFSLNREFLTKDSFGISHVEVLQKLTTQKSLFTQLCIFYHFKLNLLKYENFQIPFNNNSLLSTTSNEIET